jgi:flagellar hook-basal body complex protein FliE
VIFLSSQDVTGHVIELRVTDPRHLGGRREPDAPAASFEKLLLNALGEVNQKQLDATAASERLVTAPDTVDIHDVTIALAEANLALSATKAVFDRAISAFREITNMR